MFFVQSPESYENFHCDCDSQFCASEIPIPLIHSMLLFSLRFFQWYDLLILGCVFERILCLRHFSFFITLLAPPISTDAHFDLLTLGMPNPFWVCLYPACPARFIKSCTLERRLLCTASPLLTAFYF